MLTTVRSKGRPMTRSLVILALIPLLGSGYTHGMGQEEFGPSEGIGSSPDWPVGVREVMVHPARVYCSWVNGNEHAYFDGGVEAINEVIQLYSEIRMKDHGLVVVPGTGEAKSFHGKVVRYKLMFEVPGGIYFGHVVEKVKTGLYALTPRLTLRVDDAVADDLDKIRIPANITLKAMPYQPADAVRMLRASHGRDRWVAADRLGEIGPAAAEAVDDLIKALSDETDYVRAQAAWALGQIGKRDTKVIKAVEKAGKDDNEKVRNKASEALKILRSPADPSCAALRRQVETFLKKHPQNAPRVQRPARARPPETPPGPERPALKPEQLPTAADLLAKLRQFDDLYRSGFTATGRCLKPSPSGYPQPTNWTLTMGNDRLVLVERFVPITDNASSRPTGSESEVAKRGSSPTWSNRRAESVIFTGPEFLAQSQVHRIVAPDHPDGTDSRNVTRERPGTTYDFLVGRVFWTTGRGYANQISRITSVEAAPDGLILARATSRESAVGARWELLVDPDADYMVRSGKLFRHGQDQPWVMVVNSGLQRAERRCLPENAVWSWGPMGADLPFTFTSLSAKPDLELIRKTEADMQAKR